MMDMIERIAARIMEAKDRALEAGKSEEEAVIAGQDKYRAYFVRTKLYLRYKPGVDDILDTEGYGNLIVSE